MSPIVFTSCHQISLKINGNPLTASQTLSITPRTNANSPEGVLCTDPRYVVGAAAVQVPRKMITAQTRSSIGTPVRAETTGGVSLKLLDWLHARAFFLAMAARGSSSFHGEA
jgi:hypothetical protein